MTTITAEEILGKLNDSYSYSYSSSSWGTDNSTLLDCEYQLSNPAIDYGLVLPLCFAALFGIVGNGSLILVGVFNTNLRSSGPNILLLQLALAALVYIVVKVPCVIDTSISGGCWRYGLYGCKILSFAFMFSRGLMVWTLTASSINLCCSLVRGVRIIPNARSGLRAASKTIVLTWTWSFIISVPSFFLSNLWSEYNCISVPLTVDPETDEINYRPLKICYLLWTILQYILPLIIIGCAYGIIAYKLVQSTRSFNESQPRMRQFFDERRRLVRIFYFITGLFASCWFPFYLFHLLAIAGIQPTRLRNAGMVASILFPCIYPWITYLMSEPYRKGVKNIFRGHGYQPVSSRGTETCGHSMQSMNNVDHNHVNNRSTV